MSLDAATRMLLNRQPLREEKLCLHMRALTVAIRSNRPQLLDQLRHYFRHLPTERACASAPTMELMIVDQPPLQLDIPWQEWKREAGKQGHKDAYVDGEGFRLIRKVRTGMLFLQSAKRAIAAGPCQRYCNQIVNFILNQQMNALQQRGWLICHAAAVEHDGRAIALAGFSGGGKSTAMLHLMADARWNFVSNDRLFLRRQPDGIAVEGVAKLPRVNPGTLLHNPKLRPILTDQRIGELEAMPADALWQLEEKYDVDVIDRYGNGRIHHQAQLAHFIILNWSHDSNDPTTIARVRLADRPQLLQAIMKSPGPFYQHRDGSFQRNDAPLPQADYQRVLATADLREVRGRVDFDDLYHYCNTELSR